MGSFGRPVAQMHKVRAVPFSEPALRQALSCV